MPSTNGMKFKSIEIYAEHGTLPVRLRLIEMGIGNEIDKLREISMNLSQFQYFRFQMRSQKFRIFSDHYVFNTQSCGNYKHVLNF